MPNPCKTVLEKETSQLSRDSSAGHCSWCEVHTFRLALSLCVQLFGDVYGSTHAGEESFECLRERVALCCISSVLFLGFFFPLCSLVKLYWQKKSEVKTVLFILFLS